MTCLVEEGEVGEGGEDGEAAEGGEAREGGEAVEKREAGDKREEMEGSGDLPVVACGWCSVAAMKPFWEVSKVSK